MENNSSTAGRHLIIDLVTNNESILKSTEHAETYAYKVTELIDMQLVMPVITMKFPFNSELHQLVKHLESEGTNSLTIEKYSEYVKRKEVDDTGVSSIGIWNTSHLSSHSWNEYKYISIDLFSCNTFEIEEVLEFTKKHYDAKRMDILCVDRFIGKPQIITQFTK